MEKTTLKKIIDYLENPSQDAHEDCKRRGELYGLLNLKSNPTKRGCPYLTGPLGEEIVEVYYRLKNIPYDRKQKIPALRKKGNRRPDGLENDTFYVEVKMRAYHSSGTAHEKIPSIAFKYGDLPKKLKIYLLADDEHSYNTYWSQLLRNQIEPMNNFEKEYRDAHSLMIEEIVYGTEIANFLRGFLNS